MLTIPTYWWHTERLGRGSCRVEHDPDTVNISLRENTHKALSISLQRHAQIDTDLANVQSHTLFYPLRTWWERWKKESEGGHDKWQKWESRYKTLLIKITSTILIKLTGSISKGVISNPSPPFQAFTIGSVLIQPHVLGCLVWNVDLWHQYVLFHALRAYKALWEESITENTYFPLY